MKEEMNEKRLSALFRSFGFRFSRLKKPIRKNLAVLTFSFMYLLAAVRGAYRRLSLAALANPLPSEGAPHAGGKRLHRFLNYPRIDFRSVAGSLAAIILPARKQFCPLILDQTKTG